MRRRLIALTALVVASVGVVLLGSFATFTAARLVICLLVFGALVTTAWGAASGRLRDGLVVVSSLVFGLAILEGGSIAFGLRPKVATADSGLSHERPIVGWGPTRPGIFTVVRKATDGHPIYAVRVTIDDHLNRRTYPTQGPGAVAFFGDSFVFGDGVADDATLPQAFSDLNVGRIPVLNLGFSGWSPAQNLAALQTGMYGSQLEKPRHFVLFSSLFHLERTSCKGPFAVSSAPRYSFDGHDLRHEGQCASWAFRVLAAPIVRFAQGFAVVQKVTAAAAAPTRADVETYIKLIETFVETAKAKYGVGTTVLFWPQGDSALKATGFTEAAFLDRLRAAKIDVLISPLANTENPIYRIAGDGHPTALANRVIARALQEHLQATFPKMLASREDAQ